jgi:hypothetical protein
VIGYPPIELGIPGKAACPDQFNDESTRACKGCAKLMVTVSSQYVYIQFGQIPGGGGIGNVQWGPEEPYGPFTGSLGRRFDAVRVRNLTPGKVAQVLLAPIPEAHA